MNLRPILALPARLSLLPARIALHALDLFGRRWMPTPQIHTDDPPNVVDISERLLYDDEWTVRCPYTGSPCGWSSYPHG